MTKEKKADLYLIIILLCIITFCIILLLSGCTNEKKVINYAKENPAILDKICQEIKDSVIQLPPVCITDTVVDTVYDSSGLEAFLALEKFNGELRCDSLLKAIPPVVESVSKTITNTVEKPFIKLVRDVKAEQKKYDEGFTAGVSKEAGKFDYWKLAFFCWAGISLLYFVYRIFRK